MLLTQARVLGVGPLDSITFPFADEGGVPRKVIVVLGGGGVGKTSLLAALASTRPGYAVAQPRRSGEPPIVVTDWLLGEDDPVRPHPLRVASPGAPIDEREEDAEEQRERAHGPPLLSSKPAAGHPSGRGDGREGDLAPPASAVEEDALALAAPAVATSLVAFIVVYFAVFGMGTWYLLRLMHKAPQPHEPDPPNAPAHAAGITPAPVLKGGRLPETTHG